METSDFLRRVRIAGNPHAHPRCVVIRGHVRFTVLTARLLRLEWSPTSEFTDFATFAFPNRYVTEPPQFTVQDDGENVRIDTGALTLTYRLGSGAFGPDNLAITYRLGTETNIWHPGQSNIGNLGGTRRTLDFTGGEVPLEPGLISRDGWAVVDDSLGAVFRSEDGWVDARPPQSVQDWYFFGYGHAYAEALADYTRFGGVSPLIPRYVLGIWWSRFWPYSASELEQLVTDFDEHALALDVLVVDMDWHTPGYWTGYTWNRELFPDPEAFLAAMHARGLRVTLNLHPADGVHPHEDAYQHLAAGLGLAESDGAPVPFRITDRQFAELYFTLLHHPLEDQGVDFWWIDWQQGEQSDIVGVDPLLWLNHLHYTDARRRGLRPLLFSRWGGLGNHRYPIGFSGDTYGGWATLAAQPRFTATAANVGFGWWSHDIGGHFGAPDGELFTRWVQFGVLSPCLRLHAVKDLLAERRPWAFSADTLRAVRAAFELRYQLMPYLYTMAREIHESGLALCRPMYYAYPEEESAYHAEGQYHLGNTLLAAPITEPADSQFGLATKDVWIPPGTWYRFDTGAEFIGPQWVRIACDLDTVLLFAPAGAVVPLARPARHLVDIPNDWLDIRVFPGSDGVFRLYEDDGVSEDYLRGAYEWIPLTCVADGPNTRVLCIGPAEGGCPSLSRTRGYTVTFMSVDQPQDVLDGSGERLQWTFDHNTRALRLACPPQSKSEAVVVVVRWPPESRREDEPACPGVPDTPPFTRAIAHTASDEAQRQLAHLIVVPPYTPDHQAQACTAEVVWRDVQHSSVTEVRQTLLDLTSEAIVRAPFTYDPTTLHAHRWEVDVRLIARGTNVTTTHRGPVISPPIQRWSLRYAGHDRWNEVQADAATRLTITEPYEVQLDPHLASAVEARTIIELTAASTISFDTWTSGDLSLSLDGRTLDTPELQPTLDGLARQWPVSRFGPMTLSPGKHVITARLAAPERGPWVFGVLLVDAAGEPLVRCAHAAR